MPSSPSTAAAGFWLTLELFDAGIDIMRHNLARQHPDALPGEIERRLVDWLRRRPGAEFGDSSGRLVDLRAPRL